MKLHSIDYKVFIRNRKQVNILEKELQELKNLDFEETYEPMEDLLENKKQEISYALNQCLKNFLVSDTDCEEIENLLYESGCLTITPPKEKSVLIHWLNIDPLDEYKKGNSIKPGNIIVNFKKLICELPEIIPALKDISNDDNVVKVCTIIKLLKVLVGLCTVKIEMEHAIIIYSLWNHYNENHKISVEDRYECANSLCRQIFEKEFTWEQYLKVLDDLEKLHCIEFNEDGLWLCESISVKYK